LVREDRFAMLAGSIDAWASLRVDETFVQSLADLTGLS